MHDNNLLPGSPSITILLTDVLGVNSSSGRARTSSKGVKYFFQVHTRTCIYLTTSQLCSKCTVHAASGPTSSKWCHWQSICSAHILKKEANVHTHTCTCTHTVTECVSAACADPDNGGEVPVEYQDCGGESHLDAEDQPDYL